MFLMIDLSYFNISLSLSFRRDSVFKDIDNLSILKIIPPKNKNNDKASLLGEPMLTQSILNDSKISKNHFSLEKISSYEDIFFNRNFSEYIFPIRTVPNFKVYPQSLSTGVLGSKLCEYYIYSIQVLIRAINNAWQYKSKKYCEKVLNILQKHYFRRKEVVEVNFNLLVRQ